MNMNKYYMRRCDGRVDEIYLENDQAAFNYAHDRGRREHTEYRAYTDRGNLIFGVYQANDSGKFDTVCRA